MQESRRFSLCADLHEQPIYKVILHHTKSKKEMVVFVGEQPEEIMNALKSGSANLLKTRFGKNFKSRLGLGFAGELRYINHTIYHDDTVQCMLSKLRHYLKLDVPVTEIYAWISISASNASSITAYFVNSLYKDQSIVTVKAVADLFHFYTGKQIKYTDPEKLLSKQEAHTLLSKHKFKSILEPLLFKYTENSVFKYFPVDPFKADQLPTDWTRYDTIYEHGRLLESFSMKNNIINVITSKAYDGVFGDDRKPVYFPIIGALKEIPKEIVTGSDQILQLYHSKNLSSFASLCHFNYIHLRVNEFLDMDDEMLSVKELFNRFKPNGDVPFIKHISSSRTEYKLYRPALTEDIVEKAAGAQLRFDQVGEWTRVDPIRFVRVMYDILVVKIHLDQNTFATVIIHANGMYDVKLNYMITEKRMFKDVTTHLTKVNNVLPSIMLPRQFVPIDVSAWVKELDETDTRVVKLMTSGVIGSTSRTQPIDNLEKAVKSLYPFLSVVSSKGGILHMLYKRIDNFSKQDNVTMYIARNHTLAPEELVVKISENFGISIEDATDHVQEWRRKHKMNAAKLGAKVYFKQNLNDFVSIKLKPTGVGYKYIVTGVTSALHHRRIVRTLKYLISLAEGGGKPPKSAKLVEEPVVELDATNIDDLLDDDLDSDPSDVAEDDAFKNTEDAFKEFMEEYESEMNEAGIRLLEMKEKQECPGSRVAKGGAKKAADKKFMFVLHQLYDADKKLFQFESTKNYAKSCQESQKRQPVVLQDGEVSYINKCFPTAIENHVKTGYTPELAAKNNYICPVIWCPKSRVALSREQFEKEFKGKCPFDGIDEEPMLFEDEYFEDKETGKSKKRYARFLHPSKHPESTETKPLYLPCCFSRPESDDKGNEKYIKAYTYPLSKNRYGLLPASLAKLFKNKFCGGKNGTTGLMNSKTNCYMREGVNLSKHSYLTCLQQLLNSSSLKTEQDIIDAIIKKLKLSTFVLLDKGLLCKKFINDSWNIQNIAIYSQFRAWFIKQDEYIVTFNLENIANEINKSVAYHNNLVYKHEIKREFLIYSSYQGFIKYLENDNIPKSHEILGSLVNLQQSWLNKHGYNVIVFETESIAKSSKKTDEEGVKKKQNRLKEMKNKIQQDEQDENGDFASLGLEHVYLTCPYSANLQERFRKEKPTIMLIKSGKYYEPIVHIRMVKNKMFETTHHKHEESPELYRAIEYYLGFCSTGKSGKAMDLFDAIESTGKRVDAQVIDYDFNLVAFYTSNKVLVPLAQPEPILTSRVNSYVFIDTAAQHMSFAKNSKTVYNYLIKLNSILGSDYFKVSNVSGHKISLESHKLDVPLGAMHKELQFQHMDDLKIFINEQEVDERIGFTTKQRYKQNVYNSFRNEVVHMMNYDSSLLKDLQFLRHPSNPISLNQKRRYLLNKLLPLINRFSHEVSEQFLKTRMTDQFTERVCSTIGQQKQCNNQCTWVIDMRTEKRKNKIITDKPAKIKMVAAHCKLAVKNKESRHLLEKVIDDLLNPTSSLKMVKEMRDDVQDDDILQFTDKEIENEDTVKMLMKMENPRIYDHEHETVPIDLQKLNSYDKEFAGKNVAPIPEIVTEESTVELPHAWRKELKQFAVQKREYDRDFVYALFAKVATRINNQQNMTATQLKRLVLEKSIANLKNSFEESRKEMMYNIAISSKGANLTKEQLTEIISATDFYPSEYELKLISEILKVNVVVISRKVNRHERIRCLGKRDGADYYVMLLQPTDSKRNYDLFELIVKGANYIFQLDQFEGLSETIRNLCRVHVIKPNARKKKTIS